MTKNDLSQINGVALTASALCMALGALLAAWMHQPAPVIMGALLGVYLGLAIKVVRQWEKVALLRLGKYVGLRGPGLFHIVPVIETLSPFVDQRVRVASVTAESTLTREPYLSTSMRLSFGWYGMPKRLSSK